MVIDYGLLECRKVSRDTAMMALIIKAISVNFGFEGKIGDDIVIPQAESSAAWPTAIAVGIAKLMCVSDEAIKDALNMESLAAKDKAFTTYLDQALQAKSYKLLKRRYDEDKYRFGLKVGMVLNYIRLNKHDIKFVNF